MHGEIIAETNRKIKVEGLVFVIKGWAPGFNSLSGFITGSWSDLAAGICKALSCSRIILHSRAISHVLGLVQVISNTLKSFSP